MLRTPTAKPPCATPQARPADDNIDLQYKQGPLGRMWIRLSKLMRDLNPVCQKIPNTGLYKPGEQCHNRATLVHHLVSPRVDPTLFLVASNLVCLCNSCHPPDDGTPWWKVGVDYVETKLPRWGF
jgi:hypothetical protein